MTVGGTICNDGLIGADGGSVSWPAGSGGSIWLTSGALVGGGRIRANGGLPSQGAAGGGGRIALVVTNSGADFALYTGTISAVGWGSAAAGTIYKEKNGDVPGKGELVIYGSGNTPIFGVMTDLSDVQAVTCEFSRITLTNSAVLNIGSDDALIMTNTVVVGAGGANNGIWISGGTLLASSDLAFTNYFIGIASTGTTFSSCSSSLTIGTNAEFRVNVPCTVSNNVVVEAGGNLTHAANSSTEAYKMNLTINGALTVKAGGRVDVTAKGYSYGYGPGTGAEGGSYGGRGYSGGGCYGSIIAPTNIGSGARPNGSSGGGAIRIAVNGTVRNDGLICADGGSSSWPTGSGGSIWITSGSLLGTGTIRSVGGTWQNNGGGGRISLAVTNEGADFSTFTGTILACGGVGGGAGTVYLRTALQGPNEGTLIVDNNSLASGDITEINANVTDVIVGNVLIRNKGYLVIATNQNLVLSGVWSNSATFVPRYGSQVIFTGGASSTSRVYGSSAFMGLTCSNTTGKTLLFEAGKTNTVLAQGKLTLNGSGANNLMLRSTVNGAFWKLNVDSSVAQSIGNVDVQDSDAMAGVGTEITALNSENSGNNLNWKFVTVTEGETNVWTGYTNTLWSSSTNWSLGRAPVETDFVTIPAGRSRYPVLDGVGTMRGLEIQTGASLSLAGYNLTVRTNAVVAGTLTASGSETITFLGDVNFSGGTLLPGLSSVLLAGSGDQAVNLGNLILYKLSVMNSEGTVAFSRGFAATEFRCEAPSGMCNLTFQEGESVILRDLVLLGAAGGTNITLTSSASGKWNLIVSGYRSVRGVDVQNSDASSGLPIPATLSQNSGGNDNWTFAESPAVWLGTNGTSFHNAANWASGVVPDATMRVLMNSANPMTITGAVTVLDLTVGGGASMETVTVNAALTVAETITVLSNGTLILNRPCVVTNSLNVLGGGTLTHSANSSAEVNKLNVTVYGNVGVNVNGRIDVTAKGYSYGYGPGTGSESGSYGGRGYNGGVCYGSIIAPTNMGSGPRPNGSSGGGAIRMVVGGTICNDGLISADGGSLSWPTGAGGSIWLTSGRLIGTGIIRAVGGTWQYNGGGGRISLVVTNRGTDFSAFTGTISACGGSGGGAGTIYKQSAADYAGRGTVWVDNTGAGSSGYTDVPPNSNYVAGEADRTVFVVTNGARLCLMNDFAVGDISLVSANTILDLGSKSLLVRSRQHAFSGSVANYGIIIWLPDVAGTIFSIR